MPVIGDQESKKITEVQEGEKQPVKAATKTSTENFIAEPQVQPNEKFTTYSGEKPEKVLLTARDGESLEDFKTRSSQYHEELDSIYEGQDRLNMTSKS